jgi:hypothetical protein
MASIGTKYAENLLEVSAKLQKFRRIIRELIDSSDVLPSAVLILLTIAF